MVSEKLKIRIKDVWERVSAGLTEKSFKKCSILNSLDGPKDDFI
jgi:hypothetical protein